MIIHIGDNISLFKEDIIMIIDKKTLSKSKNCAILIGNMIENGQLINGDDNSVKTYIIAMGKGKRTRRRENSEFKLYTSDISSRSLFKREKINV